jgi:DNA-binding NtrC family response regulator
VRNFSAGDAFSAERLLTRSSWKIGLNKTDNTPFRQLSFQRTPLKGIKMRGKICIVDNDLASRGYLRECLEREGHQVMVLESGFEAKSLLSKEQFNLFILNVDTPGVRERDFLLHIKNSHQARVLLIVSTRGDGFLKDAIDMGVYGFIYKPFDHQEVCTMVNLLTRETSRGRV